MRDALVSIAAGPRQLPLVHAARRRGLAVIGVDRDPDAVGFAACDARIVRSTHGPDPILGELRELAGEFRIVAVLTRSSGEPVATTAALARALGLAGLDPERACLATSKPGFGVLCREAGVPWAGRGVVPTLGEAGPLPLVLKPTRTRVGKRGVVLVRDPEALPDAFARARAASADGEALAEDLVEGDDVALVACFHGGRVAPIALLDEYVGFSDARGSGDGDLEQGEARGLGFALPSRHHGSAAAARVEEFGRRLCAPMGTGIGFLAFRIPAAGDPVAIEAHFELAGDGVADELLGAAGFDAFDAAIGLCVDGELPESWPALRAAAVEGPAS